jgi:hypothetical protein
LIKKNKKFAAAWFKNMVLRLINIAGFSANLGSRQFHNRFFTGCLALLRMSLKIQPGNSEIYRRNVQL